MATTKKSTTKPKNTTTQKSVTAEKLHEREPRIIAEQALYAYASYLNDIVETASKLPESVKTQSPKNVDELKTQAAKLRDDILARVQKARESATTSLDTRIAEFEKTFDLRAQQGKKVTDELRTKEPVKTAESQLKVVLDQTKNTRTQVKAAVTSVLKTADVAVDAGRKQGKNAQTQVKAAITSARKTVDTAVDAGKKLAS